MAKIKNKLAKHSAHHKPRNVSEHTFNKVYWPYLPLVLVISGLLALAGRGGGISNIFYNPTGKVLSYSVSMGDNRLLADTNTARAASGLQGLQLNQRLDAAAQAKAQDMASRDYWSHDTPDGNPPWVFVTSAGYSYQKVGENLAAGFNDEQATVNAWMASPPHRENLLDPAYSQVGFGYANVADYKPLGGGPMTIVVAYYGEPEGQAYPLASSTKIIVDAPNSQNSSSGETLAATTNRSQLALADTPLATMSAELVIVGVIAVIALWANRHLKALRRALTTSESFVIKHPLVDLGFVIILCLLFILSRSVGFIQ